MEAAQTQTQDQAQAPAPLILTEEELAEIEAGYQAWLEGRDQGWSSSSGDYEGADGYDP